MACSADPSISHAWYGNAGELTAAKYVNARGGRKRDNRLGLVIRTNLTGEETMKSRILTCIAVLTLFAALAIPVRLSAQDNQEHNKKHKHHHYQVIDIGAFGGPQSYFNSLNLTDVFGFGTAFYGFARVRNNQGSLVGFADTPALDPYAPFCYTPDCFVSHAFQWQEGVKTDLGVLPGGASSAAFSINSKGLIVGNSQNGD